MHLHWWNPASETFAVFCEPAGTRLRGWRCPRLFSHARTCTAEVEFDASQDRLFGVGDLVNRGRHSEDALEWYESRFEGVTLGNHEVPIRDWFRAQLLRDQKARRRGQGWLRRIPPCDYQRWWEALASLPLALTIETHYGPVGVVHAEVPSPVWRETLELIEDGSDSVVEIALLGFEEKENSDRARAQPVEGLRALVHGHFVVESVEKSTNRWNIDTGAGLPNGLLSLIEVSAQELRSCTFNVDES